MPQAPMISAKGKSSSLAHLPLPRPERSFAFLVVPIDASYSSLYKQREMKWK